MSRKTEGPEYFGDVLAEQASGAVMDLRLKVAIQLLNSGHIPTEHLVKMLKDGPAEPFAYMQTAEDMAKAALDLADALFEQARARGWLQELPNTAHLPIGSQRAIERNARAGVHQMKTQQKVATEEADQVQAFRGKLG